MVYKFVNTFELVGYRPEYSKFSLSTDEWNQAQKLHHVNIWIDVLRKQMLVSC
jgi:hypothetical protein